MALEERMRKMTLVSTSTEGHVNLTHLFACYPIRDQICSSLSIDAIIALSRTCKALSQTYQDLLPTQFNIDVKLSRFVTDPRRFRLQMRDDEALISGSFAVQYFDRTTYADSDLDVFVEHGDHVKGLDDYLTSAEGYQVITIRGGSPLDLGGRDIYDIKSIKQVRTYTKPCGKSRSELKIQIIETCDVPIGSILSDFYATHVFNIITWSAAYAIFPVPTFVQHKGYILESFSRDVRPGLLRKWAERGWEFCWTLLPEEESVAHSIQPRRRLGDKYTWKIAFDATSLTCLQEATQDDAGMQNNVFEMRKVEASNDPYDETPVVLHYNIDIGCPSFRNPFLRNTYVAPQAWLLYVETHLDCTQPLHGLTELGLSNRYQDEAMRGFYDAWSLQEAEKDKIGQSHGQQLGSGRSSREIEMIDPVGNS